MTIRVLVVDDQTLVRGAFTVLVNSASDLSVVGEASNGLEAVRLARELTPDVILMDIRMPESDGIEATQKLLDGFDGTAPRVLILTTFDLDQYVYEAIRAGASGFLLKDTPPAQLLDAIRIIASGDALLAPSVTRTLIAEFASQRREPQPRSDLLDQVTPREREVLSQIARGMSNLEIADELHISVATAKTHVSRLLTKLGARDRAQLVVIAYESGLAPGE